MSYKNSFLFLSIFLSICFSVFSQSNSDYEPSDTFIIKDGKANAEIVVSEKAVNMTRIAAEQLQKQLEDMSGTKLEIVNHLSENGKIKIFVGSSQWTKEKGIEVKDLKHDACRVVAGKDWLALIGRDLPFLKQEGVAESKRGKLATELLKLAKIKRYGRHKKERAKLWEKWYALSGGKWGLNYHQLYRDYNPVLEVWAQDGHGSFNAVVDFLRHLGMRWYMPGDLGRCLPVLKDIPLPKVNKTVNPDFAVRFAQFRPFGRLEYEVIWEMWMGFCRGADMIDAHFPEHGTLHVTETRTNKGMYAHPGATPP